MHHTILFKNLHSNSISIPCTTKLAFSDSASLLQGRTILYRIFHSKQDANQSILRFYLYIAGRKKLLDLIPACMYKVIMLIHFYQVGLNKSCALDAKRGARAMLIKNCKGDWGLVISKWTGYVKGKKCITYFTNGLVSKFLE